MAASIPPARVKTPSDVPALAPSSCRAALHGDFELVGLSTLLSIFDMERRSGVLLVHRTGQAAKLLLSGGRVIRARMEGRVRRSGKGAVYELCGWRDGRFEFTQAQVDVSDEIDTPTVRLLMEAARRVDEAAVASPPPDHQPLPPQQQQHLHQQQQPTA